ncbi:hypothetical protein [Dactylosporangium sp. CA-092794]|uniref:hypothetical protein n=1 Tax=Dactylosporangium sp. CA-092794 TaxID=3239929 RepID=UPI003D93E8F5
MEPGHPQRQDPPTEHSHDQVNGSPPRPKSRRGWMSDSPLDGGSGWPTSAYSIVPRQPAPPAAEEAPLVVEEAVPEPSRKGRVVALVAGLVVLVIAAVGGVLATRKHSARDNDAIAVSTPSFDATATADPAVIADPSLDAGGGAGGGSTGGAVPSAGGATPSAAASATAQPSAGSSAEATTAPAVAPPPATSILRSGTAQLAVLAGQPDDAYDFDSGSKQIAGADATAGALGISAANGAKFAVLTTAETPSLAACSAVPLPQWSSQVLLATLLPGAKVCVRTSEDRYGWFMTRTGELLTGALYTTNLDYIVYKKAGD